MSEKRLIDAEGFKRQARIETVRQGLNVEKIAAFCMLVDMQPTIDAVEVVRCRDCIHAKPVPAHAAKDFTNKALSCEAQRGDWKRAYGFSVVAAWGYCNEGERKEATDEK